MQFLTGTKSQITLYKLLNPLLISSNKSGIRGQWTVAVHLINPSVLPKFCRKGLDNC